MIMNTPYPSQSPANPRPVDHTSNFDLDPLRSHSSLSLPDTSTPNTSHHHHNHPQSILFSHHHCPNSPTKPSTLTFTTYRHFPRYHTTPNHHHTPSSSDSSHSLVYRHIPHPHPHLHLPQTMSHSPPLTQIPNRLPTPHPTTPAPPSPAQEHLRLILERDRYRSRSETTSSRPSSPFLISSSATAAQPSPFQLQPLPDRNSSPRSKSNRRRFFLSQPIVSLTRSQQPQPRCPGDLNTRKVDHKSTHSASARTEMVESRDDLAGYLSVLVERSIQLESKPTSIPIRPQLGRRLVSESVNRKLLDDDSRKRAFISDSLDLSQTVHGPLPPNPEPICPHPTTPPPPATNHKVSCSTAKSDMDQRRPLSHLLTNRSYSSPLVPTHSGEPSHSHTYTTYSQTHSTHSHSPLLSSVIITSPRSDSPIPLDLALEHIPSRATSPVQDGTSCHPDRVITPIPIQAPILTPQADPKEDEWMRFPHRQTQVSNLRHLYKQTNSHPNLHHPQYRLDRRYSSRLNGHTRDNENDSPMTANLNVSATMERLRKWDGRVCFDELAIPSSSPPQLSSSESGSEFETDTETDLAIDEESGIVDSETGGDHRKKNYLGDINNQSITLGQGSLLEARQRPGNGRRWSLW